MWETVKDYFNLNRNHSAMNGNATTWLEDIFGIACHAELLPMDEVKRSLLIGNDCIRCENEGKVCRTCYRAGRGERHLIQEIHSQFSFAPFRIKQILSFVYIRNSCHGNSILNHGQGKSYLVWKPEHLLRDLWTLAFI